MKRSITSIIVFATIVGYTISLNSAKTFAQIPAQAKALLREWRDIYAKWSGKRPSEPTNYCSFSNSLEIAPTIDQAVAQQADIFNVIPLFKKCAPIMYLHSEEKYHPMIAEEYFYGPYTAVAFEKKPRKGVPAILIPKGQITKEKLYDNYSKLGSATADDSLFFAIDDCVKLGSLPEKNKDAHGNLNTPVYVIAYVSPDRSHVYFQCMFFYGFNGPYTIKDPFFNKVLFEGDIVDFQNGHESDLEHIGILVNAQTGSIVKMFYGAHDRYEGVWVLPNQISYEDGHPVVYVAKGGHGLYPDPGIHVRVYGFANDVTNKGTRWVPRYCLVWSGQQFSADQISPIYAWILFKGDYGRRGIASVIRKPWFGTITWHNNDIVNENPGRSYADYKKFICQDNKSVQKVRWQAEPPQR